MTRLSEMSPAPSQTMPAHSAGPVVGVAGGVNGAPGREDGAVQRLRVGTARIGIIIVTWNRKGFVTSVLQALGKQTYAMGLVDVVVVDNAGTDGTLDHLIGLYSPERVVDNDTARADEPNFAPPRFERQASNTLGFRSLTLVRNTSNMGGCGGFNTGFAYYASRSTIASENPDYVWLVDDDIDLPANALEQLERAMTNDASLGLVGSRTVDLNDRARTIETTIFYNRATGAMQDHAPHGHPHERAFSEWSARVGGPKGHGPFTGLMDVDVVSACSLLARWSAVMGTATGAQGRPGVGFWDARYFIYCDDADWCLRFAKAGWRVVLNLDAVVFHTPWNLKLTPARIYYANRNRVWMAQKVLPTPELRTVTRRIFRSILADSLRAAFMRRSFHSRIILDTGLHVAKGVAGKTGSDGPAARPTVEVLRELGLLTGDRGPVAVILNVWDSAQWFASVRETVKAGLKPGEREPAWLPVTRNDVQNPPEGSVVYGASLKSRLKRQLWVMRRRPSAVLVFDQINDFPVLQGPAVNLHMDHRKPEMVQVERDGWLTRARFVCAWAFGAARLMWYAATVKPYASTTRYG